MTQLTDTSPRLPWSKLHSLQRQDVTGRNRWGKVQMQTSQVWHTWRKLAIAGACLRELCESATLESQQGRVFQAKSVSKKDLNQFRQSLSQFTRMRVSG